MRDQELVNALRRLRVETGSLACMGCGHEVMLPRQKAEKNIRQIVREQTSSNG